MIKFPPFSIIAIPGVVGHNIDRGIRLLSILVYSIRIQIYSCLSFQNTAEQLLHKSSPFRDNNCYVNLTLRLKLKTQKKFCVPNDQSSTIFRSFSASPQKAGKVSLWR